MRTWPMSLTSGYLDQIHDEYFPSILTCLSFFLTTVSGRQPEITFSMAIRRTSPTASWHAAAAVHRPDECDNRPRRVNLIDKDDTLWRPLF